MLQISDNEKIILREMLNSGISKAADSFSIISRDEVSIDVPELKVVSQVDLFKEIDPKNEVQVVIKSEINGDILGHTLLFFHEHELDLLEKNCLNFAFPTGKLMDLRTSLVLEISNIITGTLVTQLANRLTIDIFGSVPAAPIYPSKVNNRTLLLNMELYNSWILTIKTSFIKSKKLVSLPFVIIFDMLNMQKILDILRKAKT